VPFLRLPLAPRKSLAGFIAATFTGALIAVSFWGWIAPIRNDGADVSWRWLGGVRSASTFLGRLGYTGSGLAGAGGWSGLGAIGVLAGLVSGVAEALGMLFPRSFTLDYSSYDHLDLGSLDDNLTLPIISGGCILGFLKLLELFSSSAP
jgi:diacylglycerol kinase (CTP)